MNKKIIITITLFFMLFLITGCGNQDMWDTEYEYNYAYCDMKNLPKEMEIKQWTDYDGEQIQIRTRDGNTYLISTNNCFLTKNKLETKDYMLEESDTYINCARDLVDYKVYNYESPDLTEQISDYIENRIYYYILTKNM